jgi:hypothetical protein
MQSLCRRDFASLFSEGVSAEPDHTPWATRRRRETLFRDSFTFWCERQCTSLWTTVKLIRTLGPAALLRMLMPPRTDPTTATPVAGNWDGFCGVGGGLSPLALMGAYARGLYPGYYLGSRPCWRLVHCGSHSTGILTTSFHLVGVPDGSADHPLEPR